MRCSTNSHQLSFPLEPSMNANPDVPSHASADAGRRQAASGARVNAVESLRAALSRSIVGQDALLDRLVIALLTGGHVLVEGLPGLAKTTAIKALARAVHAGFQRIQFTPDLLPGDLTGGEVFMPAEGRSHFVRGPLFHDIVLADEINRAPAKVQSALFEAMPEPRRGPCWHWRTPRRPWRICAGATTWCPRTSACLRPTSCAIASSSVSKRGLPGWAPTH